MVDWSQNKFEAIVQHFVATQLTIEQRISKKKKTKQNLKSLSSVNYKLPLQTEILPFSKCCITFDQSCDNF